MNDRKRCVLLLVFVATVLSAGCGWFAVSASWEDWPPMRRAVVLMGTYSSQYDDYLRNAGRDDLTEAERVTLREKKKILVEAYPLVQTYAQFAGEGITPSAELEQKVLDLVTRLESLTLRRIEEGR